MRNFHGIEDVQSSIGSHIGLSPWREVNQERINAFAEATGDHQWIHVDQKSAKEGPFASTVAHGFLTLSLVGSLADEVYRIEGNAFLLNYGLDRVRFPAPVLTASRIRGGFEFLELRDTPRGHLLRTRATVEVSGTSKPACVADLLTLIVLGAERSVGS